jgi:hypothetical protein
MLIILSVEAVHIRGYLCVASYPIFRSREPCLAPKIPLLLKEFQNRTKIVKL